MRQSEPTLSDDLTKGLERLLCQQALELAQIDWADPEAVARVEKRGRIIQVHRSNVEKTLGMNEQKSPSKHPDDPFDGDTDALKRELERRLLLHAERLGKEEILRRLAARGLTPPALRVEVPGKTGPEGTEG